MLHLQFNTPILKYNINQITESEMWIFYFSTYIYIYR